MLAPSGVIGGCGDESSCEGFGGGAQNERRLIMLEKRAFGEKIVQPLLSRVLSAVLLVIDEWFFEGCGMLNVQRGRESKCIYSVNSVGIRGGHHTEIGLPGLLFGLTTLS